MSHRWALQRSSVTERRAALNRHPWWSGLKFWGNNFLKHVSLFFCFDVIAVGYFSTRSVCHIQFQVHMQVHTCTYGVTWQEGDELCLCVVMQSCANHNSCSVGGSLFSPFTKKTKKTSVMDNRLSNQLEERKPIGIKTWLDSHQAVTTVPGGMAVGNPNAVIIFL